MVYVRGTLAERFWPKVDKTGDCWLWTAYVNEDGYGRIWVNGNTASAHRVSYELNVGKIPKGMSVLHKCDNPPCVNPDHLFLGTQLDNIMDAVKKVRAGGPKLTPGDVRAIRASKGNGVFAKVIAADYGISLNYVYTIRAFKSRMLDHLYGT